MNADKKPKSETSESIFDTVYGGQWMRIRHTDAPWEIIQGIHGPSGRHYLTVTGGNGKDHVASLHWPVGAPREAVLGNANLIAASPDLLKCLKASLAYMEDDSDDEQEREDYAAAFNAIRRAEGGV